MAETLKENASGHQPNINNDDDQCESERSTSPSVENDAFLFFSYLEEIDGRIEYLRRHAVALSQEKESLLLVLAQLKEESMTSPMTKDEFQEICVNMERLSARCKTVDIKVQTIRTPEQEAAFERVNALVNELEKSSSLSNENSDAYKRARTFLNACSSDLVGNGAIDYKFQGLILDCVIEDQKHIRYRLESIVRNKLHPTVNSSRSEPVKSDSSENCVRPSAIASAVREIPHFEVPVDSAVETPPTDNHLEKSEIQRNQNGSLESSLKDGASNKSSEMSRVEDGLQLTDTPGTSQPSQSDMESS